MSEHTAENDVPVVIKVDGDPLEIPAFLRDWLAEAWEDGYLASQDGKPQQEGNPYRVIPPGSSAS